MATSITMPSTPKELKLHSPAGVEPAIFTWPNIELQVNIFIDFQIMKLYENIIINLKENQERYNVYRW